MKPTRDTQATLVDLLDRVLSKGLILDADIIIHVAGIPLLGVKLKAALAGIETMLNYGIWQDWDKAQRAVATEEYRHKQDAPLMPGEKAILKTCASQWHSEGIYHNWRVGELYITDRRLFLFRKEPAEILFQSYYDGLKGVRIGRKTNAAGKEISCLRLWLSSGELVEIHTTNGSIVRNAIQERMKAEALDVKMDLPFPSIDETEVEASTAPALPMTFSRVLSTT